jgi:hypothetical protein
MHERAPKFERGGLQLPITNYLKLKPKKEVDAGELKHNSFMGSEGSRICQHI